MTKKLPIVPAPPAPSAEAAPPRDAARADPVRQRSEIVLEAGKHVRLRVSADLTPGGLLSIGALVSGILLSTAVLVATAGKAAARQPRRGG